MSELSATKYIAIISSYQQRQQPPLNKQVWKSRVERCMICFIDLIGYYYVDIEMLTNLERRGQGSKKY